MQKRFRDRGYSQDTLDHGFSRDKVSAGELTKRLVIGSDLIKARSQCTNGEWPNYTRKTWGLSPNNALSYMRVSRRFNQDPEQRHRIVSSELPFDIVKKLSYEYVTDEMLERFFNLLDAAPLRTTKNCQKILDTVKAEYGITSQMSWIDPLDDEQGSSISVDAMSPPPETPTPINVPQSEELPLHQCALKLANGYLKLSDTHRTEAEDHLQLSDTCRLVAHCLEILEHRLERLEHRLERLEAFGVAPIA